MSSEEKSEVNDIERCDFASVTAVIRADLLDGSFGNQTDFVEAFFGAYLQSGADCCLDMGLVSKWLNGLAKLSPAIAMFYGERSNKKELAVTIEDVILPCLSDSAMVAQNIHALLVGDSSVSWFKKAELRRHYPCRKKSG